MARVVLENLSKKFCGERGQEIRAVENLSLAVADSELLVVVGPSGCGKTTALRLIAGLEKPDRGSIFIDDVLMNSISAKDRDVAMVFQNHALYPHMTVYENLAFGLKLRKFPRSEIEARVRAAAAMLGLSAILPRRPFEISGGEAQRTALGRALIRRPKILLFDEPLSNLDAPNRRHLRDEIKKLRRQTDAAMIYVTHDQSEAMALADRVAVMRGGGVEQIGTVKEILESPATPFVARFFSRPSSPFEDWEPAEDDLGKS